MIERAANIIDLEQGLLKEGDFITSVKKLKALKGIFQDEKAFLEIDQERVIYTVQASEEENTEGGLFWGTTKIEAGKVGSEYYWCISGSGVLIYMDTKRMSWVMWEKKTNKV